MKSYTTLRNLFGSYTNNIDSTNLTLGDEMINDEIRSIIGKRDWPFLEKLRTIDTVADQQFYNLPHDCDLVREIAVIVSSTRYTPRLSPNRQHWDRLNWSTYSSDIPEWYFVFDGQLGLWPTPATSGSTINITQKSRVIDLSIADITSTTITSITNGAKAMVVSAGLTVQMAGFYIRPTFLTTANTGDGVWYEIASVTDATNLILTRAYGGTTIAAGTAACTIAQMPLLPENFHDTPVKLAASNYWDINQDPTRSQLFMNKYDRDIKDLIATHSAPTTDMVIDDGGGENIINPNLVISI